jgi:hypothetical protein
MRFIMLGTLKATVNLIFDNLQRPEIYQIRRIEQEKQRISGGHRTHLALYFRAVMIPCPARMRL